MANKILIATTNPAKKEYLKWVVDGLDFEPIFLDNLEKKAEIKEIGKDFKENAQLKASQYSKLVDYLTISADSGVFIPVLGNNWDSLLTHRFAGEKATDLDRANKLLEIMKDFKGEDRIIYFKNAVSLAKNSQVIFCHETKSAPRYLTNSYNPDKFIKGHWVANLLYYPESKKHYLELSEEERFGSHWQELKEKVQEFLKNY